MIAGRVIFDPSDMARLRRQPERLARAVGAALAWTLNDARDHARAVGMGGGPGRLTSRHGEAGLRGSIGWELRDEGLRFLGVLHAGMVYAAIHEFGGVTRPHEIRPRRGRALRFAAGGRMVFARLVRHPGSRVPARPYLRPALEFGADKLRDEHLPAALRVEGLV